MKILTDKLGKVSVTVEENHWSNSKDYNKLTIVEAPNNEYKTYISRKPVPAGTPLTNRKYWIPFSSLKEEIVLDFNSFVNLWTNNLAETNNTLNSRITEEVSILNARITRERNEVNARTNELQAQINSNDKDIAELYKAVASVVAGGVVLLQTFGNREDFGISQKVLTESRDNLQAQIDAIVSEKATVSLSVSPNTLIVGERTFTLEASTNTTAESIVIKHGSEIIISGSGKTLSRSITVSQNTATNIAYTAEFTFASDNKRTDTATVYFVNKVYVGVGNSIEDVAVDANAVSARRSINPNGTNGTNYTVTVTNDKPYVFFVMPDSFAGIDHATMNGFAYNLTPVATTVIEGVNYKYYRCDVPMEAGSYNILIY